MKQLMLISFAVILSFLQNFVLSQVNECTQITKCGQCIATGPKCTWCRDEVYRLTNHIYYSRCDYLENHLSRKCKQVSNPSSNNTALKNLELKGDTRVSPQEISVNLRPGDPTTVKIRVKTPKDFPVDLYYLMDLSDSLKNHLEKIRGLGGLLAKEMENITSNFRLGFGAFVDKPLGPYTDTEPNTIKHRILTSQYTIGFNNYLPLNSNPDAFKQTVSAVNISFNNDNPEGSLDALMQATVCDKDIGWRDKRKARRIIVITTDGLFHYSGDGLPVGIVTPNDGRCHLANGLYEKSTSMDYPSLSFLRKVMIDNEIVPIFATINTTDLYKKVAKFFGVESAAVADTLKNDSSNVVDLIKEAYEKIAKSVSVTFEPLEDLDVEIAAVCGKNKLAKIAKSCNDVALGEEIEFRVKLTAKSCSPELLKKKIFSIKTSFDNVQVKLNLICNCECEHEDHKISNSTLCSFKGDVVCGQCFCQKGLVGRECQCNQTSAYDASFCKRKSGSGSDDNQLCSGRGSCECGECKCFPSQKKYEIIYGKDCECSNATCERSFGEVCGGPSRGKCECNKCKCGSDWTGTSCGEKCLNSTAGCFKDGVECNGKGVCVCGKCQCLGEYVGRNCEECISSCPDPCEEYKECVRCKVFQTGKLKGSACEDECNGRNVTGITKVDYVRSAGTERCVVSDDDDCSFVFTYKIQNETKTAELFVQKERICPAEPDILAIILGVIAGIVGIGLALLLIWKLLATIQDRREFAKFDKDRENARWQTGENPIFKQATSTFQNPLYAVTYHLRYNVNALYDGFVNIPLDIYTFSVQSFGVNCQLLLYRPRFFPPHMDIRMHDLKYAPFIRQLQEVDTTKKLANKHDLVLLVPDVLIRF